MLCTSQVDKESLWYMDNPIIDPASILSSPVKLVKEGLVEISSPPPMKVSEFNAVRFVKTLLVLNLSPPDGSQRVQSR